MSQFWKGYRMLYVYSDDLSEPDVLTILENNSCVSVICAGRQRAPVLSPVSPVQAQDPSSYLYRRNDFFTDKNHRASVFYVPESCSAGLERSIRELSAFHGTFAGTDGKSSFPWLAPAVACSFFLLLLFFSRKRLLFASGASFFLLLVFCQPLYTVSAAACLYFLAFFLFHRLWLRKDFIRVIFNSPYAPMLALSPLAVLLFSSLALSAFYAAALAGSVSLVCLLYSFETVPQHDGAFEPVLIRSARMIPVIGHLGIRLLGSLVLSLAGILAAFSFMGKLGSLSDTSSMPSLPAPVGRADSELVSMSDFLDWAWDTLTFPYRKIGGQGGSSPKEGESVSITDYVESDGKIVPVTTTAYVFNNEFRDSVCKSVDRLDYPALEKLMLRQGRNSGFAYTKSASSVTSEKFAGPLLLILIAVPVVLGVYYILGRKRYGLSI